MLNSEEKNKLENVKSFGEIKELVLGCSQHGEESSKEILEKALPLIENIQDGMLMIEKSKNNPEILEEAILRTLGRTEDATEYNNVLMAISLG